MVARPARSLAKIGGAWDQRVHHFSAVVVAFCSILVVGLTAARAWPPSTGPSEGTTAFVPRAFDATVGGEWIGNGISYGPHRDGQRPGGISPTTAELREDLHLLRKHWRLLRLYSSRESSETILNLIRQDDLGMKVMLGAWIASEKTRGKGGKDEPLPEAAAANRAEVDAAIRLANDYPDVVIAISVGNETQVSWSSHPVDMRILADHIRRTRAATTVPVTTADDFSFWKTSASRPLANELDFLVVHAYAMWNSQSLDAALPFTRRELAAVAAVHPGRLLVLGETGWATRKHNQGEQSRLIIAAAGEDQQDLFFRRFTEWTTKSRIINFYFEAFDENWKGGAHPDEVEKHWGLFRADRTPKRAMATRP